MHARDDDARGRVGAFELIDRIGRGPRADVWRARTTGGAFVALKRIHPHVAARPNFLTLFEKQTAALTAMAHPNILGAIDRGRAGDQYFIVSELVHQGSLEEVLRTRRMAIPEAVEIALGVCDALDYAHRRALVHRNLVPANIFVGHAARVRVADFGVSLLSEADHSASLDGRSDLHALARLLYETISGSRAPTEYKSLAARIPGIPARLDDLLARALSADVVERFSRASEMALALRLATRAAGSESEDPDALTFTGTGDTIHITISAHASAINAKARIDELNRILNRGGPWKVSYDLSALTLFDDNLAALLVAMHTRHQRRIERVAFCSAHGLVRSTALMIAWAGKRVPWKTFAAAGAMRRWLEQPEAGR